MAKAALNDIIVVIPGIMGSVLEDRNGEEVWSISGQAIWRTLRNRDFQLKALRLKDDDPARDCLDDGIRATQLLPDAHIIPGLWKIDGYSWLTQQLKLNFQIQQGDLENEQPANYFEFAYDWRRTNILAAHQLKTLIDRKLPQWQQDGHPDARVILITHSMGGLIARYYLEVLGGAEHCRVLYTFGTPLKGSIQSLNFLANGYKELFLSFPWLKPVMRSFTSLYQLLPLYKSVRIGEEFCYVTDLPAIDELERDRMHQGHAFLRELLQACDSNGTNRPYQYRPIVGVHQKTFQSIHLNGTKLVPSYELPNVPVEHNYGDGTVPRISAIPDDGVVLADFIGERHGSLQNHTDLVYNLIQQIILLQQKGKLSQIRDNPLIPVHSSELSIALEVEDLYDRHEAVTIRAAANWQVEEELTAWIEPIDGNQPPQVQRFAPEETVAFECSQAGLYRLQVSGIADSGEIIRVHDIFEVVR